MERWKDGKIDRWIDWFLYGVCRGGFYKILDMLLEYDYLVFF